MWILVPFITLLVSSCSRNDEPYVVENLSFRTVDGKVYRWKDLKGKVLIIDFWATWCDPCRKSMPELESLYKKYKGKLIIVGFSKDDDPKSVLQFIRNGVKVSYPVAMSNSKLERMLGGILGLPTTFIVDREGRIIRRFIGYVPAEVLEQNIRTLINQP